MTLAIEARGLVKTFGETRALDGVDLRIERGSVYGLLGPNGAGKTTTIRALATLIQPTEGTATVLGHDVVKEGKQVRQKISLTGQFASVDEELTGLENLILIGRLLGLRRAESKLRARELMEAFGLADAAGRLVNTYSGGMRRRLDIAASLVVTPEILFLDEPTTGLDPRSRNQVWDIVRGIAAGGTTVLLTTQYLEEADRLADRMAVIDNGKVIAEGTSHDLKASVGANTLKVRLRHRDDREAARAKLEKSLGATVADGGDPAELKANVDATKVGKALDALAKAKISVAEYSMGAPTLDEVFFALTGRAAEDQGGPSANGAVAADAKVEVTA
ncbi:MAG: ATP-binding cassette domain-containing protein [Thermoplasmatota archaeon]